VKYYVDWKQCKGNPFLISMTTVEFHIDSGKWLNNTKGMQRSFHGNSLFLYCECYVAQQFTNHISPWQQWLHECTIVLHVMYFAGLVTHNSMCIHLQKVEPGRCSFLWVSSYSIQIPRQFFNLCHKWFHILSKYLSVIICSFIVIW